MGTEQVRMPTPPRPLPCHHLLVFSSGRKISPEGEPVSCPAGRPSRLASPAGEAADTCQVCPTVRASESFQEHLGVGHDDEGSLGSF